MEQKNYLREYWREHLDIAERELDAFTAVRREDFIQPEMRHRAYEDTPLPILRGKTISQPTTVMIMTANLALKTGDRVFEVGSGSGYQTAILAKLVGSKGEVISTEVIPELVTFARENLARAGIANVKLYEEDGSKGLQRESPFDKIIITAACSEFPPELLKQLKVGGIIVGPVGSESSQEMVKGVKTSEDHVELEFLGPFLFSPMYGKYGFAV